MTDLEMTQACAKAMGIGIENTIPGAGPWSERFDPLYTDAQAFAMLEKFRLRIYTVPEGETTDHWHVAMPADVIGISFLSYEKDLKRAIVECVAKFQSAR